jgi:hypothetical protein
MGIQRISKQADPKILPSPSGSRFFTRGVCGFLFLLGVLQCLIYCRDLHHFYQGDTIYWMYHRAASLTDFLRGFLERDVSGWYRPLGNRLLPFALFPLFGLEPTGYRILLMVLLWANSAAVFVLAHRITRSKIAAAASSVFMGVHTINAIVVYDAAFAPELLYGLSYLCATIAFLRYQEIRMSFILAISLICFIISLCSKEAAVTLPAVLFIAALLKTDSASLAKRLTGALMLVKGHLALLAVYLVFSIGYLHVAGMSFWNIVKPPERASTSYDFVFGKSILQNASIGISWALNIPQGWIASSQHLPIWAVCFLKTFGIAIAILSAIILFHRKQRGWLLFGIAWFFIAAAPALALQKHFLPYYLFLPLAGFSLVIATAVDWLYELLKRWSHAAAVAACALPFPVLIFICAHGATLSAQNSPLLGGSARIAQNAWSDFTVLFPKLSPDATLYIINYKQPDLPYIHAEGDLFRLYSGEKTLKVIYWSKEPLFAAPASPFKAVISETDGHLKDITAEFSRDPSRFLLKEFRSGPYELKLKAADIQAGDLCAFAITRHKNKDVQLFYKLNGSPIKVFPLHLDAEGRAEFKVTRDTPQGLYEFIGFSTFDSIIWRTNKTITVH